MPTCDRLLLQHSDRTKLERKIDFEDGGHFMDANRLSKRCRHFLSVLDRPGACARLSPIDENRVIASVVERGISMGGGSFELTAVDRLRARDLVRRISDEKGRPTFVITEAGRACLRRSAAAAKSRSLPSTRTSSRTEVAFEGVRPR